MKSMEAAYHCYQWDKKCADNIDLVECYSFLLYHYLLCKINFPNYFPFDLKNLPNTLILYGKQIVNKY